MEAFFFFFFFVKGKGHGTPVLQWILISAVMKCATIIPLRKNMSSCRIILPLVTIVSLESR